MGSTFIKSIQNVNAAVLCLLSTVCAPTSQSSLHASFPPPLFFFFFFFCPRPEIWPHCALMVCTTPVALEVTARVVADRKRSVTEDSAFFVEPRTSNLQATIFLRLHAGQLSRAFPTTLPLFLQAGSTEVGMLVTPSSDTALQRGCTVQPRVVAGFAVAVAMPCRRWLACFWSDTWFRPHLGRRRGAAPCTPPPAPGATPDRPARPWRPRRTTWSWLFVKDRQSSSQVAEGARLAAQRQVAAAPLRERRVAAPAHDAAMVVSSDLGPSREVYRK